MAYEHVGPCRSWWRASYFELCGLMVENPKQRTSTKENKRKPHSLEDEILSWESVK